jgi:hypothetical protein
VKRIEVVVNDLMQEDYVYYRSEPMGRNFHHQFAPELTPQQMLQLGVFGGKYMTDCVDEFPSSWFEKAQLCHDFHDPGLNFFGINASLSLSQWLMRGWIFHEDPRGWFQWYCRYFMGRRCVDDERQIRRWKAITRHVTQIRNNCQIGDLNCRKKQRQAVLHWAYDSRRI